MFKIINLFLLSPTLMLFNFSLPSNTLTPIFIGKIIEVYDYNSEYSSILVNGYIHTCKIYCSDFILILDNNTSIIDSCSKEKYNIPLKKDDIIFVKLDLKMTKSIPPQILAKTIEVSSQNNTIPHN